jgi:hypothetical protein
MRITGYTEIKEGGQTFRQDVDTVLNDPAYLTITGLPLQSITFSSGARTVFPREMNMTMIDDSSSSLYYYELRSDGIYEAGVRSNGGPMVEPKEPALYLKRPLRVGDSWTTSPNLQDLGMEFGDPSAEISGQSKYIVLGGTTITVKGRRYSALRIDVVTEMSLSMTIEGLTSGLDGQFITKAFHIRDTGIVSDSVSGTLEMRMSGAMNGTTLNMHTTTDYDEVYMELTSAVFQGPSMLPKKHAGSTGTAIIDPLRLRISESVALARACARLMKSRASGGNEP